MSIKKQISTKPTGRATPLLVVIGAQKSGTTALYEYLCLHPQLVAPPVKELNRFNTNSIASSRLKKYAHPFSASQSDFHHLEEVGSFDVSPAYMLDAEQVISRIHRHVPNTKIVALLRDPIDRAYSAWNMYKTYYKEDQRWFLRQDWVRSGVHDRNRLVRRSKQFGGSFNADVMEELKVLSVGDRIEMPIVEFGLYKAQLEFAYDQFPRDSILVLDSTEFRSDTECQLRRVEELIGIENHQWTNDVLSPRFVGSYDKSIPESAADCLREVYRKANRGLCRLVGRNFSWQSE
jgi:hypothetical protein